MKTMKPMIKDAELNKYVLEAVNHAHFGSVARVT